LAKKRPTKTTSHGMENLKKKQQVEHDG